MSPVHCCRDQWNPVGMYKEGNKNIPIVVRLRPQDRARLSQIENLYVNSSQENVKVPLLSVATLKELLETATDSAPRALSHVYQSCAFPPPASWHRRFSHRSNLN